MRKRQGAATAALLAVVVSAGCGSAAGKEVPGGQQGSGGGGSATSAVVPPAPPSPTPVPTVDPQPTGSTPAAENAYKTTLAPQLLHNTTDIDSAFQALIRSDPPLQGEELSAQIRRLALDPSIQLRDDARGYTGHGEPLTSVHAIFLASLDQKIQRYEAFVDGATSGDKNDLTVAQTAAVKEDADLKEWARKVESLP